MTASTNRCRWCHDAPAGRCSHPLAFPGTKDVPEFCMLHLAALEPWAAARAQLRSVEAAPWIEWARKQAESAQYLNRLAVGRRPDRSSR